MSERKPTEVEAWWQRVQARAVDHGLSRINREMVEDARAHRRGATVEIRGREIALATPSLCEWLLRLIDDDRPPAGVRHVTFPDTQPKG